MMGFTSIITDLLAITGILLSIMLGLLWLRLLVRIRVRLSALEKQLLKGDGNAMASSERRYSSPV